MAEEEGERRGEERGEREERKEEESDTAGGGEERDDIQRRRRTQRDFDEVLHRILLQPDHVIDMLSSYIYSPFIQAVYLPPAPSWCGNTSALASLNSMRREDFSLNTFLVRVRELPAKEEN